MNQAYLPLANAAELAYRELSGKREAPLEQAALAAGLERLRRAGVCFSEVRW